jgi:hypothetical protein
MRPIAAPAPQHENEKTKNISKRRKFMGAIIQNWALVIYVNN